MKKRTITPEQLAIMKIASVERMPIKVCNLTKEWNLWVDALQWHCVSKQITYYYPSFTVLLKELMENILRKNSREIITCKELQLAHQKSLKEIEKIGEKIEKILTGSLKEEVIKLVSSE